MKVQKWSSFLNLAVLITKPWGIKHQLQHRFYHTRDQLQLFCSCDGCGASFDSLLWRIKDTLRNHIYYIIIFLEKSIKDSITLWHRYVHVAVANFKSNFDCFELKSLFLP